jgi:hypothetical protein
MDGNGTNKLFDGIHAARALAEKAKSGKRPTKKVIIHSSSTLANKMFHILSDAKIDVVLAR